jgi:hypothetical protein
MYQANDNPLHGNSCEDSLFFAAGQDDMEATENATHLDDQEQPHANFTPHISELDNVQYSSHGGVVQQTEYFATNQRCTLSLDTTSDSTTTPNRTLSSPNAVQTTAWEGTHTSQTSSQRMNAKDVDVLDEPLDLDDTEFPML